MTLNRTNIVLAGLLVVVMILAGASRVDYTRPNIEILSEMKYTPAWTTYERNRVFADGPTLRPPVTGTIARGQMPLYFTPTKEDALRAGEELPNPYQAEPTGDPTQLQESIRRGEGVYRVFCVCCHGATGAGDGPVPQRGFPPPPSLLTGMSVKMKDGQLFHVLSYGQGSMTSFAGQLALGRRWDVINYVRSMQAKASTPDADTSAPPDEGTQADAANETNESEHENQNQNQNE